MSKKLVYASVFLLIAMIIVGIVIGSVVIGRKSGFDKEITVNDEGTVKEELDFRLEGMIPGKSVGYSIGFNGTSQGMEVVLTFRSKGDVSLARYVEAELTVGEKSKALGRLGELIDGEKTVITLGSGDNSLTIKYTMPDSVGNEAQGLSAEFVIDIEVTAG